MTGLDLEPIRRRVDAASSGPWMAATNTGRKDGISLVGRTADRGTGQAIAVFAAADVRQRAADAEFTSHARTDVPALLAELVALRAAYAEARRRLAEYEAAEREAKP